VIYKEIGKNISRNRILVILIWSNLRNTLLQLSKK